MKLAGFRSIALMIARETTITLLLLIGVSFVVFVILYLSPGDPFSVLLEGQMSPSEAQADIREALDVPRAWYLQYLSWFSNMARGNFGSSIRTGLPVAGELVRVGLNTLALTLSSLLVTLAIAIPIAVYSARRGASGITWALTMFAYVVSALPVFWFGYIVIYFFMHSFGVFPVFSGIGHKASLLSSLLPVFVLGVGNGTISEVIRFLRDEMGRVMSEDYIRTARAKGASIWKHSFKEGLLIPVTEIVASKIPFILGGAVIVEQVFNWPGMGRMAWQAAQDRDYPVIMGIAILAAVFVRMGGMFQKVVYVIVNPRASKE